MPRAWEAGKLQTRRVRDEDTEWLGLRGCLRRISTNREITIMTN